MPLLPITISPDNWVFDRPAVVTPADLLTGQGEWDEVRVNDLPEDTQVTLRGLLRQWSANPQADGVGFHGHSTDAPVLDGEYAHRYAFGGASVGTIVKGQLGAPLTVRRYKCYQQRGAIGNDGAGKEWLVQDVIVRHVGEVADGTNGNGGGYGIRYGDRWVMRRILVEDAGSLTIGGVGKDIILEDYRGRFGNMIPWLRSRGHTPENWTPQDVADEFEAWLSRPPGSPGIGTRPGFSRVIEDAEAEWTVNPEWEGGSSKFVRSSGIISVAEFDHSLGRGDWEDIDNEALRQIDITAEWNFHEGIVFELAAMAGGLCKYATSRFNGLGFSGWGWGGQYLFQNVAGHEISNFIAEPHPLAPQGIWQVNQDRGRPAKDNTFRLGRILGAGSRWGHVSDAAGTGSTPPTFEDIEAQQPGSGHAPQPVPGTVPPGTVLGARARPVPPGGAGAPPIDPPIDPPVEPPIEPPPGQHVGAIPRPVFSFEGRQMVSSVDFRAVRRWAHRRDGTEGTVEVIPDGDGGWMIHSKLNAVGNDDYAMLGLWDGREVEFPADGGPIEFSIGSGGTERNPRDWMSWTAVDADGFHIMPLEGSLPALNGFPLNCLNWRQEVWEPSKPTAKLTIALEQFADGVGHRLQGVHGPDDIVRQGVDMPDYRFYIWRDRARIHAEYQGQVLDWEVPLAVPITARALRMVVGHHVYTPEKDTPPGWEGGPNDRCWQRFEAGPDAITVAVGNVEMDGVGSIETDHQADGDVEFPDDGQWRDVDVTLPAPMPSPGGRFRALAHTTALVAPARDTPSTGVDTDPCSKFQPIEAPISPAATALGVRAQQECWDFEGVLLREAWCEGVTGTTEPPVEPPVGEPAVEYVSISPPPEKLVDVPGTYLVAVRNSGALPGQVLVDVELYAGFEKVAQGFVDNVVVAAGEVVTVPVSVTVPRAGNFRVAVGLFPPGWGQPIIEWVDSAAQVTYTDEPVTPPDDRYDEGWADGREAGWAEGWPAGWGTGFGQAVTAVDQALLGVTLPPTPPPP